MTPDLREDLVTQLIVLSMHYPTMRFGQLLAFAGALAGEGFPGLMENTTDEAMRDAIDGHLAANFGAGTDLGSRNGFAALTETRGRLVSALTDLGQRYPRCSTGRLLAGLAALAHATPYDVEDEQLVEAARATVQRAGWFDWYVDKLESQSAQGGPKEALSYRCPCCRHQTLSQRGGFDICPVCYWEDDGQDESDADTVRGGPNGSLSLAKARANYSASAVCDPRFREHVRPPRPEEI